jgi:hypothetical protein
MGRWSALLIGVLLVGALAFGVGFMWWSRQTYTVGMAVNLQAYVVAGLIVLVVAGAGAGLALMSRRRRG